MHQTLAEHDLRSWRLKQNPNRTGIRLNILYGLLSQGIAQTIIAAIKDTPEDMQIDFVIHTPGGLVLAAMQIARAVLPTK